MEWGRVGAWSRKRFALAHLTSSQLWGVVSLGLLILLFQLARWLAL